MDILDCSVSILGLTTRAANCLDDASIATIGQLVAKSRKDMLKYRNFGLKSLKNIEDKLREHGLALRTDPAPAAPSASDTVVGKKFVVPYTRPLNGPPNAPSSLNNWSPLPVLGEKPRGALALAHKAAEGLRDWIVYLCGYVDIPLEQKQAWANAILIKHGWSRVTSAWFGEQVKITVQFAKIDDQNVRRMLLRADEILDLRNRIREDLKDAA
jgi:hypothetical protein